MTNEQLAAEIQAGDRSKIPLLWNGVKGYAYRQANRWYKATRGRGGVTLDDLEQEAFIALLEALEGWDEKAGKFLTWYDLRLKSAFTAATAQRTQRDMKDPLQDCISLYVPLTDQDGDPFTLEDTIPDQRAEEDLETVEERDRQAAIRRVLNSLQAEQQQVIALRYFHDLTREQTAQRLHLTKTRTAAIEAKALRVLRHHSRSKNLRQYL